MNYTTKPAEKSTVKITMTFDGAELEAAVEKAYQKNKFKFSVNGFRKGKAPRSIIEKMYGKGVFYDDAINDVLPDAYEAAAKESGLEIDFVIRYKGKCTLVEVKATTGNAKSLKTVLKNYEKYHIDQAFKFGNYNIGRNGQILTLPLYMGFLLTEY